jgi:hypothetical protein
MGTVPTPPTIVAGEDPFPSSKLVALADCMTFSQNPPACRAYRSTTLAIATATRTAVPLDAERWDTDGIHSTSVNTSRLTCQTAGRYSIVGHLGWVSTNSTGTRQAEIRVNGATILAAQGVPANSDQQLLTVATEWPLAVGDYVELTAYQTGGISQSVLNTGAYSPELSMSWQGKA